MTFVQTKDQGAAASGSTLRIEVPAANGNRRAVIATAHGKGNGVIVSLTCSGTNRVVSQDGHAGASATQIFALDPGFTGWVEAKVEGSATNYDLVLSVAAM